jgi:hypothetical protein
MSITAEDLRTILTRPIAFHRLFAAVGGSVGAGVFLSQLFYWSERTESPEGWVYKSAEDWFEETMLSRRELDTVRKALKQQGVVEEKLSGVPPITHYRINWDNLFESLKEAAQEHRDRLEKRRNAQFGGKRQIEDRPTNRSGGNVQINLAENAKLDQPKAASQFGGKRQITNRSEITTQTTPENTTTTPRVRACAKAVPLAETSSSFSFVPDEEEDQDLVSSKPNAAFPSKSRFPAMPEPETLMEAVEQPSGKVSVTPLRSAPPATDVPQLDAEAQQIIGTLDQFTAEFVLTGCQRDQVHQVILAKGLPYVLEQAAIVRSKPRKNLAGAFLAALRDGWSMPKSTLPAAKPQREVEPVPEGWQDHLKRKFARHNPCIPDRFEQLPRDIQEETRREMAGIMQSPPPPERAPEPVQGKRPSLGLRAAAQAAIEAEMGSCTGTALISPQQQEEAA